MQILGFLGDFFFFFFLWRFLRITLLFFLYFLCEYHFYTFRQLCASVCRPNFVAAMSGGRGDGALTHEDTVTKAYRDSIIYTVNLGTEHFTPLPAREIVRHRCCAEWCNLDMTTMDVIMVRAGFVRALDEDDVSRQSLKRVITAFIHSRITLPRRVGQADETSMRMNLIIADKPVCKIMFLEILGIPEYEFKRLIGCIATGDPYVSHRRGCGRLPDKTLRAIARIGVSASVHGQWNPSSGAYMIGRGVRKSDVLRTNSRRGTLDEGLLNYYVNIAVRRRGVDSFMRCDYCVTLDGEHRRITNLVRLNNARGSTTGRRNRAGAVSYTAQMYMDKVYAKRREVLYRLFGRYKNTRKALADGDDDNPPRDFDSVRLEEVIPAEDVELRNYCTLLNEQASKAHLTFGITVQQIRQYEILDMDDDAVDAYMDGLFLDIESAADEEDGVDGVDHHVFVGHGDGDGDMDGGVQPGAADLLNDIHDSVAQIASDLRPNDTVARQNSGLLTALERLTLLRKFHNEHISAERVIAYSALETAALLPQSMITFTADAMSKQATKLPIKDKSKDDETVGRIDCYLTGLQMSVAVEHKVPRPSVVREEVSRRTELMELKKMMKSNPNSYSVADKEAVEDELVRFEEKDVAAASGFGLVNNDFLYPYPDEAPCTDALVSNILYVLASDQVTVAPMCIALVLDNGSTNKSIYTLHAFALILELIPKLREIHLLFPTVGHTHNSLDAHFGAIGNVIKRGGIGTPQDLADAIGTVKNTNCHVDWPYYKFARKIGDVSTYHEFDYLSQQHYFCLYKDKHGEVLFDHERFLRFAEPFSDRVSNVLSTCAELLPRTRREEQGCSIFEPFPMERVARERYAKEVFPDARDRTKFGDHSAKLTSQLILSGMQTEKRKNDLDALVSDKSYANTSLYDICQQINDKTYESAIVDGVEGVQQELMLSMFLRMKGRTYKQNEMAIKAASAMNKNKDKTCAQLVDILLEGDDGTMRDLFVRRLDDFHMSGAKLEFKSIVNRLKVLSYTFRFIMDFFHARDATSANPVDDAGGDVDMVDEDEVMMADEDDSQQTPRRPGVRATKRQSTTMRDLNDKRSPSPDAHPPQKRAPGKRAVKGPGYYSPADYK